MLPYHVKEISRRVVLPIIAGKFSRLHHFKHCRLFFESKFLKLFTLLLNYSSFKGSKTFTICKLMFSVIYVKLLIDKILHICPFSAREIVCWNYLFNNCIQQANFFFIEKTPLTDFILAASIKGYEHRGGTSGKKPYKFSS